MRRNNAIVWRHSCYILSSKNEDIFMPLMTIGTSGNSLPVGAHQATFLGLSQENNKEGKPMFVWNFEADGKAVKGFTDAGQPTDGNKLGRWLCGLAGKPLKAGDSYDPDTYIGKRYMLIVTPAKSGNGTRIDTFTPMSA
jgi:hypothetical protein